MYSTVNPNLCTFSAGGGGGGRFDQLDDERTYVFDKNSRTYVAKKSKREVEKASWQTWMEEKYQSISCGSGTEAKKFLRREAKQRGSAKQAFLSEKRTAMTTQEESKKILQRSFEYITALMEFNMQILEFQFNHYLYASFQSDLLSSFANKLVNEAPWGELVEENSGVKQRIGELKELIGGLGTSLLEVQQMQRRL